LQEGRKTANIHGNSGFIWGIPGRFNLAQGFVGTLAGIGATLSTTFFGLIVGNFGSAIGFLSIAAAALCTVLLAWLLMPETKPSNEKSEPLRST
jgi:sugar phosphate permease